MRIVVCIKQVPATTADKRYTDDLKQAIGADKAQAAPAKGGLGLTGKGVRVAVLDSGVNSSHADLKSRVVKSLIGHKLITNRSLWRNFPMIRNARWVKDNLDQAAMREAGRSQAVRRAAAEALAAYRPTRVVASDLARAAVTAQHVAEAAGVADRCVRDALPDIGDVQVAPPARVSFVLRDLLGTCASQGHGDKKSRPLPE